MCSNLLEKTTDAVIKAAKNGDLALVIKLSSYGFPRFNLFRFFLDTVEGTPFARIFAFIDWLDGAYCPSSRQSMWAQGRRQVPYCLRSKHHCKYDWQRERSDGPSQSSNDEAKKHLLHAGCRRIEPSYPRLYRKDTKNISTRSRWSWIGSLSRE